MGVRGVDILRQRNKSQVPRRAQEVGHRAAPAREVPAPGLPGRLLWPKHQAVSEAELASEARPGNSAWLKSYHSEDGGGAPSRSRSTGARTGIRGKGAPAAHNRLSPSTESAAASPLAKMAALSHVSNRKRRGSKGGRRGDKGRGNCA